MTSSVNKSCSSGHKNCDTSKDKDKDYNYGFKPANNYANTYPSYGFNPGFGTLPGMGGNLGGFSLAQFLPLIQSLLSQFQSLLPNMGSYAPAPQPYYPNSTGIIPGVTYNPGTTVNPNSTVYPGSTIGTIGGVMPGGFSPAATNDPQVVAAGNFAAQSLGGTLKQITSAQSQVVAGTNYRMTIELTNGQSYDVTVFRNLPANGGGLQLSNATLISGGSTGMGNTTPFYTKY